MKYYKIRKHKKINCIMLKLIGLFFKKIINLQSSSQFQDKKQWKKYNKHLKYYKRKVKKGHIHTLS